MTARGAIFFDLDGTLFDTRADLAATVNHTRCDLGLAALPADEVIVHVGRGARYLLEHAIAETDRPYDDLWRIFIDHYAEHCCEKLVPYPGVLETLDALAAAGWRLGVNTNKPNFAVKLILAKFGLERIFGAAVVAGGDGVPLKPDPASIRECAARLGGWRLSARDWMVGDSWTDMRCAEAAGVNGAFCEFGFGLLDDAPCAARLACFGDLAAAVGEGKSNQVEGAQ